jgi:endonuclease/exonuclease/phosphatase family metal-dependent hydrolase
MMGIEPTTFGTTTRRSNQMSYIRQILCNCTTGVEAKKDPWGCARMCSRMDEKLTIVSWNIAGGRTMRSLDHFDYEEENLSYFADVLRAADPDIILLQEVHFNDERSVAKEIAALVGYKYVYEQPMSPSHIDDVYRLGMAVLSKRPLEPLETLEYPYPHFPLFFSDGRPAAVHHKGAQLLMADNVMIANTQMLPLAVFGAHYEAGEGAVLAEKIQSALLDRLKRPVILGGDFNFNAPRVIYPHLYERLQLHEALPDTLTRPNKEGVKQTPDHILYSEGIALVSSRVQEVQADHYLCIAEFALAAK